MEMQIKTTLRFHLTPVWQPSRKQTPANAGEDAGVGEGEEPSHTVGWKANWCNHYGNQNADSSKDLNRLSYDPDIPLSGLNPKGCKSTYTRDTCVPMFIAALFTTAELWNQLRCPTTNEQMKYSTHARTNTKKYYSAIEKNEIMSFVRK
jgi:hypothetical protein